MSLEPTNYQRPATRSTVLNTLANLYVGSDDRAIKLAVHAIRTDDAGAVEALAAHREAKAISSNTSDKNYRQLVAHANCTSYSMLANLHNCPRLYELEQLNTAKKLRYAESGVEGIEDPRDGNVDFAFGHAVGAGIQTYAATQNLDAAILAGFLAWKIDAEAEKLDKRSNMPTKSLWLAVGAITKFKDFWDASLYEFEVVRLPNGKPAVELAFAVDFENGYYHFGHIDVVLVHKPTGRLVIWEGKTTGYENVDEAMYANSNQALGYSVVVDRIAQDIGANGTDYEVLYIVYSAASRTFQMLPFGKSRSQRADWLQDILFDHAAINTYSRVKMFPKRGEACYHHGMRKRCFWFGTCTMQTSSIFPGVELKKLDSLDDSAVIEAVDFKFTLTDLIAGQGASA